jgi:hypothetical protein
MKKVLIYLILFCSVFLLNKELSAQDKKMGTYGEEPEVSLADLMLGSDIIIEGTFVKPHRNEDSGMQNLSEIKIKKIIASVWENDEIQKYLSEDNKLFILILPFADGVVNDPILIPDGDYLLFLKQAGLFKREEAEKYGLNAIIFYKVVHGTNGAILMSNRKELKFYKDFAEELEKRRDPATLESRILMKNFKTNNKDEILTATNSFSEALMITAPKEKLDQFAKMTEPIFLDTAKKLLKIEEPRKFRTINKRLKSNQGEAEAPK